MFLLFYFEHQTLNGTVRPHDNARPHAARNTTQFLANNIVQSSPLVFLVPRLEPKQTHLERVGETCSRQSKRPWKCAWVVSGTQAGVGGHPNACELQPDPIHTCGMLGSNWFSRRTHSLLLCVSLSLKLSSNWTFSWTRRVLKSWTSIRIQPWHNLLWLTKLKTPTKCQNQLQNQIWWTWMLVVFSNNSVLQQTKYAFLFSWKV